MNIIMNTFQKTLQKLVLNNSVFEYSKIPWDSEYLQNTTIEFYECTIGSGLNSKSINDIQIKLGLKKGDLLVKKIDTTNNIEIQQFSSLGFYFIEQTIQPYTALKDWRSFKTSENEELRGIEPDQVEWVKSIAMETFVDDRFHVDPNISDSAASYRFGKWIENSIDGNDTIEIFYFHGKPAGFFIYSCDFNTANLRLAGLDSNFKGYGLGKKMYGSVIQKIFNSGIENIETSISLNNLPVLNLYSYFGFRFRHPQVVLHSFIR